MNIKEMSVEQLKVLAYDAIANIQANQRSLDAINQEIASRVPVKPPEAPAEPTPAEEPTV